MNRFTSPAKFRTVADKDLDRAVDCAKLLQKATDKPTIPVVIDKVIPDLMQQKATERGAGWTLLP
ncbi:MAG: hypothetical protein R2867_20510 [Caldilineaceae bacterium]